MYASADEDDLIIRVGGIVEPIDQKKVAADMALAMIDPIASEMAMSASITSLIRRISKRPVRSSRSQSFRKAFA